MQFLLPLLVNVRLESAFVISMLIGSVLAERSRSRENEATGVTCVAAGVHSTGACRPIS